MGILSDLFDPGRDDRRLAQQQADQGIIEGVTTQGPGGITAGTSTTGGQTNVNLGLGSFDPLLGGLQGIAAGGIEQAGAGFQDFAQQGDFQGLGDIFQGSLATAQADPFELGSDISAKLRQISERRNARLVNKTFDRLKGAGQLGTSGGIGRAGDLERNIFEQGLKFDIAGLEAGQGLQRDAFGRALGASQGRGNIFSSFLQNQAQGANLAFGGTQAASNLSQLPLSFLAAGGAEATRASNTRFASAGVSQGNAALAKSPFLEAVNAAAGLTTAIRSGGVAS